MTTHLTDFMLEEHRDVQYVPARTDRIPEEVLKLGVQRSFGFWVSLFMILALAPLIMVAIIKDKQEVDRFGKRGNIENRRYAPFWFLYFSVRRKEKYLKPRKQKDGEEEKDKEENQQNEVEMVPQASEFATTKINRTSITLSRQNTPAPAISQLDEHSSESDSFEREPEHRNQLKKTSSALPVQKNSILLEESKDEMNPIHNEFDDLEEIKANKLNKLSRNLPHLNADTGMITEEERRRITKKLKQKSSKKRERYRVENTLVDDNASAAESVSTYRVTPNKPVRPIATEPGEEIKVDKKKLKSKKPKLRKKGQMMTQEDLPQEDLEGGEEEKKDATVSGTGNPFNDDLGENPLNIFAQDQDTGISVKKRKKKILKKKLKKKKPKAAQGTTFDSIGPVYYDDKDDEVSFASAKKISNRPKFRTNEFFETATQGSAIDATNAVTQEDQLKDAETKTRSDLKSSQSRRKVEYVNEKALERHYDGKLYCKTLLYSHRVPNVYTFYNDRLPRFIRLLILYVSMFLVLFLSGVFYMHNADTNSVNGMGVGHCIGFAILTTCIDWVAYLVFSFLFLYKPLPDRQRQYLQQNGNDELEDADNQSQNQRPDSAYSEHVRVRKYDENEMDDRRKKINKMTAIIAIVILTIIILFGWGFVIAMSTMYSERAGHLWALTFFFALVMDFGLVECSLHYLGSKLVFKRKWDLRDQQ